MMKELDGKFCLVTGATSGIGEATARGLAERGATVVVAGRNRQKCIATVERIKARAANARVDYLLADLASQAQIRTLADEFKRQYQRLDVLINNAGIINLKREESIDGIELTFAVNHLSYFLLTLLLLDILKASAPARIVNVSSHGHHLATMNFDDLESRHNYGPFRAYCQSKLANILFTRELARRLSGTGVTVNCLHPGTIRTGLGAQNGWVGKLGSKLFGLFVPGPEQGARTSLYLATSPEVEGVTGKYFAYQRESRPSPAATEAEAAQHLWAISAHYTGLPVTAAG